MFKNLQETVGKRAKVNFLFLPLTSSSSQSELNKMKEVPYYIMLLYFFTYTEENEKWAQVAKV